MTIGALLIVCLAGPIASGAQGFAERKIEGTVLRTRVTLCELRPRGCAGYLILDAKRKNRRERVMVQVRLGVPIKEGEERYVSLATLAGSKVSVLYANEKGGIVARSITVIGKAAP